MRPMAVFLAWVSLSSFAYGGLGFREGDRTIEVSLDDQPLTVYRYGPKSTRPYFWPILIAEGLAVTRGFPEVPDVPGETRDHPWHRGLSFSHGRVEVEGREPVDFWAEGVKEQGRIVHRRLDPGPSITDGVLKFATRNDWLAPDGTKLVEDHAQWRVDDLGDGAVRISLAIELTAGAKALRFGDSKEGNFSVRVTTALDEVGDATGLRRESPRGHVIDSGGQVGAARIWGKPADWVDYSGRVGDIPLGVSLFDHPGNRPRTRWHVRDYGLLSANVFGERAFGVNEPGPGVSLKPGESVTYRFALLAHPGTVETGHVARHYQEYLRVAEGTAKP